MADDRTGEGSRAINYRASPSVYSSATDSRCNVPVGARGRSIIRNIREPRRERRYVPPSASERNGRAFAIAFTGSGTRESYLHLGEGRCRSHGADDTEERG